MKTQPAIFLKMLVLLVPRELQIEHRGGVKGMTEEQIVDAIEAIEGFRSALGYGPRRAATRGATRLRTLQATRGGGGGGTAEN